ncbi:putative LysR-family transcriptional regulator [Candidatus Burkholderia verschuerenii]|uniref:Putative LysR-family transcriptional regulator n=1 Tax=Candidatus Burkholderia verschuerenii TaxID=242163 RepID=A0A0L0MC56_9BURK|nr:LysR substrate-binding domain-containing protein [Candidatus Burkholderia verschuerenii]KND59549.1 putative LysR-family transcriptional regulator [Candidatus Burkholderia verschuerenii]
MRRLPSLTALRFFEESARHMSFNKSVSALCVTPGAISRQIRLLEDSLGTRLFDRDHKGIRLTAQGRDLLECIADAFDAIERVTRSLSSSRKSERKRLTVCAPPTFATRWLSPRLGSFMRAVPDVDLSVRTDDADERHFSIRFGYEALADRRSDFLFIERHVLVGAARYADEPLDALLARLPALHVLHNDARLTLWPDWLDAAGLPREYEPRGIEFSTLDQAIHAALAGTGIAVVDRSMIADELRDGTLAMLSAVESTGPYGYWIDVAAVHADDDGVKAFAQWLRAEGAKSAGLSVPLV